MNGPENNYKKRAKKLLDLTVEEVEKLRPSMGEAQLLRWQEEMDLWKPQYKAAGIRAASLAGTPNSPAKYKRDVQEWQEQEAVLVKSGLPVKFCYWDDLKVGDIFCRYHDLRSHVENPEAISWLRKTPPPSLSDPLYRFKGNSALPSNLEFVTKREDYRATPQLLPHERLAKKLDQV